MPESGVPRDPREIEGARGLKVNRARRENGGYKEKKEILVPKVLWGVRRLWPLGR